MGVAWNLLTEPNSTGSRPRDLLELCDLISNLLKCASWSPQRQCCHRVQGLATNEGLLTLLGGRMSHRRPVE